MSALRAVVEMIGLCFLGQGILGLLAGKGRDANPVYRLLALVTDPPRRLVRRLLPAGASEGVIGAVGFALLFVLWILFAWIRKNL